MRVLYQGVSGPDVTAWQNFLRGWLHTGDLLANGVFDAETKRVTQLFQMSSSTSGSPTDSLTPDGVVGNNTYAKAMKLGFSVLEDTRIDDSSYNWPPKPAGASFLSDSEKEKLFGAFQFEAAPTPNNPEGIKILGDWVKNNIITVNIPQIVNLKGAPRSGNVQFHKLGAKQLQDAFVALEKRDQFKYLISWGGSWVPRFIRGSTSRLSNHSLGGAVDINPELNQLGTHGAAKGTTGSVREIVETMFEFGFYWGNWFPSRPDPMHFELFKVL